MSKMEKRIYDEKFLEILRKTHGVNCANCGCDKNIEYHHIVPLVMGGSNKISNFVPLCYVCHNKVHGYKKHMERRNKRLIGRPKKISKNHYEIFEKYKIGEIGSSEAKKLLGVSQKTHFTENKIYKNYLNENGIKYIRNNVDVIMKKNGFIENGRIVGHIEFIDGNIKEIKRGY